MSLRRNRVGQFRHPRGAMGQVAGCVISRYETVTRAALILGTVAAIGIPCAFAQERFEWEGTIAAGKAIEIKGINGKVEASAASGNQVQVVATKSSRLSDVSSVQIETIEHADGVTICAVYPSDLPDECKPGAGDRINRDNDVEVDFTVQVPAGVRFIGRNINGNIEANSIDGNVEAYTVNGQVQVSTTGVVQAKTVNGSIEVSMGRSDWEGDLTFETVNGSITIELPDSTDADVQAETLNGTIGNGGGDLRLTTVNGSIRLRRSITGSQSYSTPDRCGFSVFSQGTSANIVFGYGRVRPDAGSTTPSGVAIFGFRQNGVLVSKAGVPASPLVTSGRIFAEIDGPVRTGLAIANPNDETVTIWFVFTDADGVDFGNDNFALGPGEQIAKFLDEDPFNSGSTVLGTFTFFSNLPISVIALRGFTNERSEFLMTTLPVTPLTAGSGDTIYFPHFADGAGWTTQVILVNPTDSLISGRVRFFGTGTDTAPGQPESLTLSDAQTGSEFTYSIPPRSSTRLQTSNPPGDTSVGSVRVIADAGSSLPSGVSVFSFEKDGVKVSEAGVPASAAGAAFRVYVEASGVSGQPGSVFSGLALTNTSETTSDVFLELTNLDGTLTELTETITVPASGQVARFIDELFPSLTTPFAGILRITSTATDMAVVGLRLTTNERNDFLITTTPPSDESTAATSSDLFFPHFVDSGGWTTQFILFSGRAGQTSSGRLSFIDQTGQALDLSVN